MAKLDGQWGGDFSNVTHAVAELQRVVASHQYAVADLGALRGNLIALARPVDTPEKRTAAKNGEAPPPAPAAPAAEDGAAEGGVVLLVVVFSRAFVWRGVVVEPPAPTVLSDVLRDASGSG